ncbi:phosphotransferase family protein [Natronorarus salvus]|uniref:phosphotransferase family protein n=1 Tax=Natronorarus salvus TaxID=3117733 RepID=UPI002F265097
MTFDLSLETVRQYLIESGYAADTDVTATRLGGGVSNHVIMARVGGDCLVLKQPLPDLDVAEDWPADVERVHNEAAATRVFETILDGTELAATVPGVLFEDRDNHIVGMECASSDARMWKEDLLEGTIDCGVAREVGRVLGTVHEEAATDPELLAPFEEVLPFVQLRIDPYHRIVMDRHPDVSEYVGQATENLLQSRWTLVHGDYSPKNVLVEDRDGGHVWILDFEVAHRGNPAFDTAFMLNHLFIKSIYNPEKAAAYHDAAGEFFGAYDEAVSWDIEADTIEQLGVLMLARVDGKSPVEYVTRERTKGTLRRVAKRALVERARDLREFETILRAERA